MVEKRVTRSSGRSKAKATQQTLHDLFASKSKAPSLEEVPADVEEQAQPILPSPEVIVSVEPPKELEEPASPPPSPPPGPVIIRKSGNIRPNNARAQKVFSIFSGAKPMNTDPSPEHSIIDITQITFEPLPTQPIISKPRKRGRPPNAPQRGHSAENPIELDSSPVKAKKAPLKLFDSRNAHEARFKGASVADLDVPYPDGASQHVRGPQSALNGTKAPLPFARRVRGHVRTAIPTNPFFLSTSTIPISSVDEPGGSSVRAPTPTCEVPTEFVERHPAIRYALDVSRTKTKENSCELWTEKWAPQLAERVLGNEYQALFLRDWLNALQIQNTSLPPTSDGRESKQNRKAAFKKTRGVKRPRIRREVSKRRNGKRQKLEYENDPWLLNDDDCSSEAGSVWDSDSCYSDPLDGLDGVAYDTDTDPPDTPQTSSVVSEQEYVPPPLEYPKPNFTDLSNTIILCGPHGSGKTAAVYACAAELDWEVFEAYPGIGRRNGASLDSLVGQVGKNHMVVKKNNAKTGQNANGDGGLASFFSKRTEAAEQPTSRFRPREPSEPREVDILSDCFELQPDPVEELDTTKEVRQSLILLEEVDILFKDDVNFWPTVVNIIKECRRPVILTCNDISLIPVGDLPLQTTLYFSACPQGVAACYLKAIGLAEGLDSQQTDTIKLKRPFGTASVEPYQTSLHSHAYECDLRGCIHELQLQCLLDREPVSEPENVPRESWEETFDSHAEWPLVTNLNEDDKFGFLRSLDKHMQLVSLVDSGLIAHVENGAEYANPADEEVGHRTINSHLSTPSELAFYRQDICISQNLLSCSRSSFRSFGDAVNSSVMSFSTRNPELVSACVYHRSHMIGVAIGNACSAPLSDDIFVDYEPYMRYSTYVDNMFEAQLYALNFQIGGRPTRNSQRASNRERALIMEEHQKRRMEQTGFRLD